MQMHTQGKLVTKWLTKDKNKIMDKDILSGKEGWVLILKVSKCEFQVHI